MDQSDKFGINIAIHNSSLHGAGLSSASKAHNSSSPPQLADAANTGLFHNILEFITNNPIKTTLVILAVGIMIYASVRLIRHYIRRKKVEPLVLGSRTPEMSKLNKPWLIFLIALTFTMSAVYLPVHATNMKLEVKATAIDIEIDQSKTVSATGKVESTLSIDPNKAFDIVARLATPTHKSLSIGLEKQILTDKDRVVYTGTSTTSGLVNLNFDVSVSITDEIAAGKYPVELIMTVTSKGAVAPTPPKSTQPSTVGVVHPPLSTTPVPSGELPSVCSGSAFTPGASDPWGGCWPGEHNTGVPAGATLTPYTGSCTISVASTVIDSKTVNCILSIRAPGVVIRNSQINGGVDVPSAAPADASFAITDSNIHVGDNLNTGLMRRNFTADRVDITGGRRSVYCMSNCTVQNSWAHGQGGDPGGQAHFSGMRMEQDTTYRHNSITCEATRVPGSGCSAGLTGYGDFAPIQRNLIERNLFYRGGSGGSTICAYGGSSGDDGSKPYGNQTSNIRFIGNRFVIDPSTGFCGNIGTIRSFDTSRPGNQWTDNLFDTGVPVNATGP